MFLEPKHSINRYYATAHECNVLGQQISTRPIGRRKIANSDIDRLIFLSLRPRTWVMGSEERRLPVGDLPVGHESRQGQLGRCAGYHFKPSSGFLGGLLTPLAATPKFFPWNVNKRKLEASLHLEGVDVRNWVCLMAKPQHLGCPWFIFRSWVNNGGFPFGFPLKWVVQSANCRQTSIS